jgi:hypothetical protein
VLPTSPLLLARIEDEFVGVMFFGAALVFGVVFVVTRTVKAVLIAREVERSRRDIAAYIAEGSMSPEDGQRLMAAGPDAPGGRIPRA